MDRFNPNTPINPNTPNNLNNPNNPNNSNIFSVPGYYPQMEPNPFGQFTVNAFAGFQQSLNTFNTQQMQAVNSMMMRNPFNAQPFQSSQPHQPEQSSQPTQPDEDDIEVVPETQPQSSKRKKGKQVVEDKSKASKPNKQPWTPIEEEALAKAWISSSTNAVIDDNQPVRVFGKRWYQSSLR